MVYWTDFVSCPTGAFYGKDMIIEIISAIVVLSIALFSIRNYRMDLKNKKHLAIGVAFLLLGLGFLARVLTNYIVHNPSTFKPLELAMFGQTFSCNAGFLSALGYLTYAMLTLFGFYMMYALSSKDKLTMNYIIIAYFIVVTTYLSRFNYFLFYLTAFIFVAALTRRYFLQYKEFGYRTTLYLGASFLVISASQVMFLFSYFDPLHYVTAELVQLVGYLGLLYTFVMVLSNARKKDKA